MKNQDIKMKNVGKIQFLDRLISKIDEKKVVSICENDKSYSLIDRNKNRNKLLSYKRTGDYTKLTNDDVEYFTSLINENLSSRRILKNVGQLKRVCECLNIPVPTSVPEEIVEMINIVLEDIESKTGDKIVILDPLSMTVATVELVQHAIVNIVQLSDEYEETNESSNINQGLWYKEQTEDTSYSLDIRECEGVFEGVDYIELSTAKDGEIGEVTDKDGNEYEYKIQENKILLNKIKLLEAVDLRRDIKPYRILGLEKGASKNEIRTVYEILGNDKNKESHDSKYGKAPKRMKHDFVTQVTLKNGKYYNFDYSPTDQELYKMFGNDIIDIQESKKTFDFSSYRKNVFESIDDDENRIKKIYDKVYNKFDETDVILVYGMLFGKLKDYSEGLRDDIVDYFIKNPKSIHNAVLENKIQESQDEVLSDLSQRYDDDTIKEIIKAKKDFFIRTDIDGEYTKLQKKGNKWIVTTLQ